MLALLRKIKDWWRQRRKPRETNAKFTPLPPPICLEHVRAIKEGEMVLKDARPCEPQGQPTRQPGALFYHCRWCGRICRVTTQDVKYVRVIDIEEDTVWWSMRNEV